MPGAIYKVLVKDFMKVHHALAEMRDMGFIQRLGSDLRDENQEEYKFRYSELDSGEIWIGNQFNSYENGRHCTFIGLRLIGSEECSKVAREELERRAGIKLSLVTYLN